MTLTCEPTVVCGEVEIIAIAERRTLARRFAHAAFLTGEKRPVAIIVRRGAAVRAFDIAGGAADVAALQRRCADLRARLRARPGE